MGNFRLFIACILLLIAFIFTFIFHQGLVDNLGECRQPDPGTLTRAGRATGFLYHEVPDTEDTKPVCVGFHSADSAQEWVSQYAPVSLYGIWHGSIIAFVILILPEICAAMLYLVRDVLNHVLQTWRSCAHVCSITVQYIVRRLWRRPSHCEIQQNVGEHNEQKPHEAHNGRNKTVTEQFDNCIDDGSANSDEHVLPEKEQVISTGLVHVDADDTTSPVVNRNTDEISGDSPAKFLTIVTTTDTNDIISTPIMPPSLPNPYVSSDLYEDNHAQRLQEFEETGTENISPGRDDIQNGKIVQGDQPVSKLTVDMVLVGISTSLPAMSQTKPDFDKSEEDVCFSGFEADIGDSSNFDKLSTEACAGSETISSSSRLNSPSLLELLTLIENHKSNDDVEAACRNMQSTTTQIPEINNAAACATSTANQYLRNNKRQVGNIDFQVYRSIVSISHQHAHLKRINDVHGDVTLDTVHPGSQPEANDPFNRDLYNHRVGVLVKDGTERKPSPELDIQSTVSVARLINEFSDKSHKKAALSTDKDDSNTVHHINCPVVQLDHNHAQDPCSVPDTVVIPSNTEDDDDGFTHHAIASSEGDLISSSCTQETDSTSALSGKVSFNSSPLSTHDLLESRYTGGVVQSIRDNWKRHCFTEDKKDDDMEPHLSTHQPRSIGRSINERFKNLYDEEESILV